MGSLMAAGTRYGARTAWAGSDAANLPVGVAVLAGVPNQVVIQSFCTIAGIWLNVERERERGPVRKGARWNGAPSRSRASWRLTWPFQAAAAATIARWRSGGSCLACNSR